MNYTEAAIAKIMRKARDLPAQTSRSPTSASEASALARQVGVKFADDLKKYARYLEFDRKLLDGEKVTTEDLEKTEANRPPEQITFITLQAEAYKDPESALALWQELKTVVREDIANGWEAGRMVTKEAWERASFLAIREDLQAVWPPRNGVESMIIDEMAQYEMLRRQLLIELSEHRWTHSKTFGKEYLIPVSLMQAVDRLQRLFQYSLRMLLSLRRSSFPLIVPRSSQPKLAPGPQADTCTETPKEELAHESAATPVRS
jgi:hypothetical protein